MSVLADDRTPPDRSPAAILLVDDNPGKLLAIDAVLRPLGHTLVEVSTGEEALRAVTQQTFAVILMDVQMPVMNGYETARLIRMRAESEHTPIIFVTAHAREEATIPIAYESGAVDFIFAPIVPDVLRAKVGVFVELFLKARELELSLDEVKRLSRQFRYSEARTRAVLDNVADGIVTVSEVGLIESVNRAASVLFGYEEQEAQGQPFARLLAPDQPDQLAAQAQMGKHRAALGHLAPHPVESVGKRKNGSSFPMQLEVTDVSLGPRQIQVACVRDISERKMYTETLKYQVLHDDLTDLPNRVLFGDRVNHAITAAVREGEPLALLVMDLDEFKQVNDTLGHQYGDLLLKLVAERLLGCLREADTVARLGGDEFGILPIPTTDLAGAVTIAWKIERALKAPFLVGAHEIEMQASIGITLVPEHGDNIDDLLRRADLAMYDAKRSGAGYAVFAAEQEETPARRVALLGNLRNCVANDELLLHYQPKIDLATRRTVGAEALIRWNHPSGKLMMPGEFMPEVERNALITPITEWVIDTALGQLSQWRAAGYDLTIAVNLGARCMTQQTDLFATVDRLVEKWDIPAEKLILELTESALLDTATPGLLECFRTMDERLSIDDFGTGYSSLVYLQRLPVVEIKADRSFVTNLTSVCEDAVIVRSIIDLAHNLSLTVVAEGVEDEATMTQLLEYGCDEAQGYYFSRPLPGPQLLEWLASSPFGAERLLGVPAVPLSLPA